MRRGLAVRVRDAGRIVRWAALAGFEERRSLFTWRTWVFGWLLRLLAQVLFFALIGVLLGSQERVVFLFVGNVALIVAGNTLAVAPDASEERYAGTLPLLVAAPASAVHVFTGKTLLWMAEATTVGTIAFVVLAPVLGFDLVLPDHLWVPLVLGAVALGCYGLGIFLASLLFRAVQVGNTVFNFVWISMAAICGVNVALDFFPGPVQAVANVLPLTHGLLALRGVTGQLEVDILAQVGLELAIGAGWMLLAVASFRWFAEGGRKAGTLDWVA